MTAIAGLALMLIGGTFLVDGAVSLARGSWISETVIGLTIVAVGTSMPEFVTSVVAGLKRQGDVAFGNIVESNIYNILGIGGFTALIAPGAVPDEIALREPRDDRRVSPPRRRRLHGAPDLPRGGPGAAGWKCAPSAATAQ